MDEKKDIATLIQEAVDEVIKFGTIPCVIICNKKTWKKVALYFRKLSPIEEKSMPRQIWFKYEGRDLPVLKFKYLPEDTIYVLDKDTYKKLMKEKKERYAMSYFEKYPCELLKGKER